MGTAYGQIVFSKVGITGCITNGVSVGGYVGEIYNGNSKCTRVFYDCYSRVSLVSCSGYDNAGFGNALYRDGNITLNNCYYAGAMMLKNPEAAFGRTNAFVGGGDIENNGNLHGVGTLNYCYYDKTLLTLSFSPSGTGLTTANMGERSSYASTWDFKEK